MNYILMLGLLISTYASAEVLNCVSDDGEYSFVTDVDFAAKKMAHIEYFQNGKKYQTFSNLKMLHSRSIFTGNKSNYEVLFPESARYMTFIIEKNKTVHGVFLPRNSVVSFERSMSCSSL